MRYFIMQTDDYENQLLVCNSNMIVPIVSMVLKNNLSMFSVILERINNYESTIFYGLIFTVFDAFQKNSLVVMQSLNRRN